MRVLAPGLMLLLLGATSLVSALPRPPEHRARTRSGAPTSSPVIVLGFLGGYVRHDNMLHTEVQLATRLRTEYPSRAYAEVFENHKANEAYAEVLQLLDTDHDGSLEEKEKNNARIILYGHSWGGAAVIALARQLEEDRVPVLLTIQVDSIARHHVDDAVVPANVSEAVNFYQPDSVLHGRPEIRAADPQRTKILGNFRFDYRTNPVSCSDDYPWLVRHFAKPHAEIECDPNVWNRVEGLIRAKITASSADWRVAVATKSSTHGALGQTGD
jgi:pimeloyl-ACP methyl ester carboxylesterase